MPTPGSGRFGVRNLTGVYLEEIKVESRPFDKEDTLQEFVGKGVVTDAMYEPVTEFSKERVQKKIDDLLDTIDNPTEYRVKYSLLVRAPDSPALAKRLSSMKARAFVRQSNPFNPQLVSVKYRGEANLDFDTPVDGIPGTSLYSVDAFVIQQ